MALQLPCVSWPVQGGDTLAHGLGDRMNATMPASVKAELSGLRREAARLDVESSRLEQTRRECVQRLTSIGVRRNHVLKAAAELASKYPLAGDGSEIGDRRSEIGEVET